MVSVDIRSAWILEKTINLSKNSNNILLCTDHHITRKSRMITADNLASKEIYINLISMSNCKPSQIYFNNLFQNNLSGCWDQICILPRKVTVYSCMRCFQYKIINNILFWIKNYIFLESVKLPCAHFVIQKKKQHFVFSLDAVKYSLYERNWKILPWWLFFACFIITGVCGFVGGERVVKNFVSNFKSVALFYFR